MTNASGKCLASTSDRQILAQRLHIAATAYEHIAQLQKRLAELQTCVHDDPGCTMAISETATTLTFATEGHVRAALGVGLETWNELRDSGASSGLMEMASPLDLSTHQLRDRLHRAITDLPRLFPDVSPALFEEASSYLARAAASVQIRPGTLKVDWTPIGQTTVAQALFATVDPAVTLPKISPANFFDPRIAVINVLPPQESDCHRDHQPPLWLPPNPAPIPIYDATVDGFRVARDGMYRLARRLEYYGLEGTHGAQGIAIGIAGIVAAIIIAIALAIAATVYGIECYYDTAANKWDPSNTDSPCIRSIGLLSAGFAIAGLAILGEVGNAPGPILKLPPPSSAMAVSVG